MLVERVTAAPGVERFGSPEAFWASVEQRGTPLVEEHGDDRCTVTFLWRGGPATLVANRITDRSGVTLEHLAGTDIWHLTYRMRADHRGSYQLNGGPDPHNRSPLPTRWGGADSSVFALPKAPPQPWEARSDGLPRGTVDLARNVWTYTPAWQALATLVLLDGDMWFGTLGFHHTLDALIADGAIPSLEVLAPDAISLEARWRNLAANDAYIAFLADDLLAGHPADPSRTVIAGQSLGGLTALYAGLRRPDRFGKVLAQSASLWWRPGLPPTVPKKPVEGVPWLVSLFTEAPPSQPLMVRLDVGLHEGAMVDYHRAMYDALRSGGFAVTHNEFNGGHDYACWRGGLADGLVSLLSADQQSATTLVRPQ